MPIIRTSHRLPNLLFLAGLGSALRGMANYNGRRSRAIHVYDSESAFIGRVIAKHGKRKTSGREVLSEVSGFATADGRE
jgi:hypothetical protein